MRSPPLLHLGLHNTLTDGNAGALGSCRVTLYAPYWLNNRTGVDLFYQDRTSAPGQPFLFGAALPWDYGEVFTPGGSHPAVTTIFLTLQSSTSVSPCLACWLAGGCQYLLPCQSRGTMLRISCTAASSAPAPPLQFTFNKPCVYVCCRWPYPLPPVGTSMTESSSRDPSELMAAAAAAMGGGDAWGWDPSGCGEEISQVRGC